MNGIDIAFIAVLALGAINGFRKGIIYELALFALLVVTVWGGFGITRMAAELVKEKYGNLEFAMPFIPYSMILFIVAFIGIAILSKLLEKVISMTGLGLASKIPGAFVGFLKWTLALSVAIYFFAPLNARYSLLSQEKINGSFLWKPLAQAGMIAIPEMKKLKDSEAVKEMRKQIHVH